MEKESFDLDDILEEVKKRREAEYGPTASTDVKNLEKEVFNINDTSKEEAVEEEINYSIDSNEEEAFSLTMDEEPSVPEGDDSQLTINESFSQQDEEEIELTMDIDDTHIYNEDKKEEELKDEIIEEDYNSQPTQVINTPNEEANEENGFLNFTDFGNIEYNDDYTLKTTSDEEEASLKKNKLLKKVVAVLLALIIAVASTGGVLVYKMINSVTQPDEKNEYVEKFTKMDELVESFPAIYEEEASKLASYKDMIKTWYYTGEPCSSSKVYNMLLIGEDTRGEEIIDEGTRADSAIIVSVNADTKEITLTSVLRDIYCYYETTPGDESTGVFSKINEAMSRGNIKTYIYALERLYKVDINNYVIVNFDSFEKIIDTIGGVDLEISSAEIREINNHPKRYGNVYIEQAFEGSKGNMKLTGEQALAYCRIRKLDSDTKRADRQKTCLNQMVKGIKDSSPTTLIKVVNTLIPYVKTGLSTGDILSMAKYALSQGWINFKTENVSLPKARMDEGGIGGTFYGMWCWKSDIPQDAYILQRTIYGKSSITLARLRVDVKKCARDGYYSENYTPVRQTIENLHYGEETTLESETTTKPEEAAQ